MRHEFTPEFIEKFWKRVDRSRGKDACWLWTAGVNPKGYGVVSHGGANGLRAHRVAYAIVHGAVPQHPYEVAHTCDVRNCVNPAHLKAMTHAENVADRNQKGRQDHGPNAPRFRAPEKRGVCRGERAARAKLTEDDVRAIRAVYQPGKRGFGFQSLAKRYGVHGHAIEMIVKRQSWAHVE